MYVKRLHIIKSGLVLWRLWASKPYGTGVFGFAPYSTTLSVSSHTV